MSIRKRTWGDGAKTAYQVSYSRFDGDRLRRHTRQFRLKKDADRFHAKVRMETDAGLHVPDSQSVTVKEAGEAWIRSCVSAKLERTTVEQYRSALDRHIAPLLGGMKLSRLTAPVVRQFRDRLIEGKRSAYMTRRVVTMLSMLLADAQDRGLVNQNVARVRAARRTGRKKSKAEQRRKLKAGNDYPKPDEVKAIVANLEGRWKPLILVGLFCGLRGSELRALRWEDVDFDKREIHVCRRVDVYNEFGEPKSEAGDRKVPMPENVARVLKEWRLKCPNGPLGLAFPNGKGRVERHWNIDWRGWQPAQIAAGICKVEKDDDDKVVLNDKGEPVRVAKYPGLHAMRHFYASFCINRATAGGLELPPKVVQSRLGHSSITMTMDTYGHLFPDENGGKELDEASRKYFVA